MPLKSPAQLSTVDEYKKLIKTDAAALQPAGAKFHTFGKYTFPGNKIMPLLVLGEIGGAILKELQTKGGAYATGRATVNAKDEIELAPTAGKVPFGALASALTVCGVARTLAVPVGEEADGYGAAPKPVTPTRPGAVAPRPGAPTPLTARPPTKAPTPGNGTPPGIVRPTPPAQSAKPPVTTPGAKPPTTTPPGATAKSTAAPIGAKPVTTPPVGTAKPATTPPTGATAPKPAPTAADLDAKTKSINAIVSQALKVADSKEGIDAKLKLYAREKAAGNFAGALATLAEIEKLSYRAMNGPTEAERKTARTEDVKARFAAVKKSYFQPGMAKHLGEQKQLKAGKHFKAYLAALGAMETKRDKATLAALETAAQSYLAHYDKDFSDKEKQAPEALSKRQQCVTALKGARQFRIALEQDEVTAMPAGLEKDLRSAGLYTQLLFEDGEKPHSKNGTGGESDSFWIEETVFGGTSRINDTERKQLIFKPMDAEAVVAGYPKGGSAAREVLGKAVGDELAKATGLDFGVPETSVVKIDNNKLLGADGKVAADRPADRVGSVQHFAKAKGDFAEFVKKDIKFLETIPDAETQKMAILDMVSLNTDRHAGNFLIGEKHGPGGPQPTLVPIDHGLAIPSLAGLKARRMKLSPTKHALGSTPGSEKKFSPEMLAAIQKIDPDKVVNGMKATQAALAKVHPQIATAAEITDDNYQLTKRSIQFMKKAAPDLTVNEIMDAMAVSLEDIFECKDAEMAAKFDAAMKSAKVRSAARKEMQPIIDDNTKFAAAVNPIWENGWLLGQTHSDVDAWARMHPDKALRLMKLNKPNPEAVKKIAALKKTFSDKPALDPDLTGLSPRDALKALEKAREAAVTADAAAVGINAPTDADRVNFLAFQKLGGEAKFQTLNLPNAAALKLPQKIEALSKDALAAENPIRDGQPEVEHLKLAFPDASFTSSRSQIEGLRAWREYKALGGDALYDRLGGNTETPKVQSRLECLRSLIETNAGLAAV